MNPDSLKHVSDSLTSVSHYLDSVKYNYQNVINHVDQLEKSQDKILTAFYTLVGIFIGLVSAAQIWNMYKQQNIQKEAIKETMSQLRIDLEEEFKKKFSDKRITDIAAMAFESKMKLATMYPDHLINQINIKTAFKWSEIGVKDENYNDELELIHSILIHFRDLIIVIPSYTDEYLRWVNWIDLDLKSGVIKSTRSSALLAKDWFQEDEIKIDPKMKTDIINSLNLRINER